MKTLSIKTRYKGNNPTYKENLNSAITFLRHSEDRIEVKNGEQVLVDIYKNGNLIFSGTKNDLFELIERSLNK